MARGIHDIDFYALIMGGGIFCKNRNPAFPLEVVGIHYPILNLFVGAEHSALHQHLIDQRRLAVIYVGYDCDIS